MTSARPPFLHLSDAEIDDYWKGTLTADEEDRVEQHYLDCNECAERVRVVEDLLGLRDRPAASSGAITLSRRRAIGVGLSVAAGVAAVLLVGVLAGYQWAQTTGELGEKAGPSALPSGVTAVAHLAPPTRDASVREVMLPASGIILFELDAREAAGAGTRFDLSLKNGAGEIVIQLFRIESTPDGIVRVPVDRTMVRADRYVFELTAGPAAVGYPFLIR